LFETETKEVCAERVTVLSFSSACKSNEKHGKNDDDAASSSLSSSSLFETETKQVCAERVIVLSFSSACKSDEKTRLFYILAYLQALF